MLHYSCDACKRPIHPHNDVRHVVKIEVFPAVEDMSGNSSAMAEEADHLDAMHEILERMGEEDLPFDDGGGAGHADSIRRVAAAVWPGSSRTT